MPIARRLAALLVLAALVLPVAASAQTTTVPRDGASVSTTPPVPLTQGNAEGATSGSQVPEPEGASRAAAGDAALPNTGSDPRLLMLCGLALTLIGVGLRLRTADAELF